MLKDIIPVIQKLTERQNLTSAEAEKAFVVLEGEDEESYFYFTFLAALHTKGETSNELLGFVKANEHFVPPFDVGRDADSIIDLSGTGGDRIKTPNISTLATFIVASRGITVAKQAFLGVTGLTGSADLMQALGVDPLRMSREEVRKILRTAGMVIYHANSMADSAKRKGYFNFWLKRVPKIGLTFVTAYHLVANVYSPIPMKRRVYGVFDERYLKPLAELFQKLGYTKGLVFHGLNGLDEISNIGPTKIIEFSRNAVKDYTITPEDLGVRRAQTEEIRAVSRESNIHDFLRIIYGKQKDAKRDLALLNAAAAFYAMDEVSSLRDGVSLGAELLDKGKVAQKFEFYVRSSGNISKLEKLKTTIGIKAF